jgi:sterol desaturase/sphingolipid hydroxylase (fatty acid hydroxylase superfamily)
LYAPIAGAERNNLQELLPRRIACIVTLCLLSNLPVWCLTWLVLCAGCSPRTAMLFWSFSYMKTVSDHSNFDFPINPFNWRGWNNADYHAVHHAPKGLQLNYSQPYFTIWDRVFGTYMDPKVGTSLVKVD